MVGRDDVSHNIRGRVWRVKPGTWAYEVIADGVVVLADNTGAWDVILRHCRRSVGGVDRILSAGHKLRPWADLVNEAEGL